MKKVKTLQISFFWLNCLILVSLNREANPSRTRPWEPRLFFGTSLIHNWPTKFTVQNKASNN